MALLLQGLVVQTHAHTLGAVVESAITTAQSTAQLDEAGDAHHKSGCILCQALAHSGQALAPSTAEVAAQTGAAYETAALAIRRAPRTLTHTWRSRAPPVLL
jgi:hypothetical protein